VTISGPTTLPALDYVPETGPVTYAAHEGFTVVTVPNEHELCGAIRLTPSLGGQPLDGDPLSYDPATREVTASSDDADLVDTSDTYAVKAELDAWPVADHPTADSKEPDGPINFGDACDDPITFDAAGQSPFSGAGEYDGTEMLFTLSKFNIEPERCPVVYECVSVTPPDVPCSELNFDLTYDGDSTDGTGRITPTQATYENKQHPPGVYTITIKATGEDSGKEVMGTTTLTLVDVCDPPKSLVAATLEDQSYTISDKNHPDYTHPEWTVAPAYCPVSYEYDYTPLPGGATLIDRDGETFKFDLEEPPTNDFDYDNEKVTTTVTGKTYSPYNDNPADPLEASDDFDTTINDPCLDPNFVTITAAASPLSHTADYSGTQMDTGMTFTVTPDFCQLTVVCKEATGSLACNAPTGSDLAYTSSYTIDEDNYAGGSDPLAPGTYTVTYKAYTGSDPDAPGLTKDVSFDIVIEDPCVDAVITAATAENHSYTLSDTGKTWPFTSDFSVVPAFCQSTMRVSVTPDTDSLSTYLTFD